MECTQNDEKKKQTNQMNKPIGDTCKRYIFNRFHFGKSNET